MLLYKVFQDKIKFRRSLNELSRVCDKNKRDKSDKNLIETAVLDSWINCGFCDNLRSLALEVRDLAETDNDGGPGPKFYAESYLEGAIKDFGQAYYLQGFHNARAKGLYKIVDDGTILNRLSDLRIREYSRLGWTDKVLQMSAYLINFNLRGNCNIVLGSCLPSSLRKYAPNRIWNDNLLLDWGEEFAPSISRNQFIFSDEYVQILANAFNSVQDPRFLELLKNVQKEGENVIEI